MKALILAAGYATRLYPLTKERPKSLLKVRGRPIIDYIVAKLQKAGINKIIVVTNSRFISQFKKWRRNRKHIILVDDLTWENDARRGAVGDIDFAIDNKKIKDDLLVVGGDNLFDGELDNFLKFSQDKKRPVVGTYDIHDKASAVKYGVIKLDKKNRIVDFQEKSKKPNSTLVAMCLYYFPKEKLGLIKKYMEKKNKKDATGFYIDWLRRKVPVYGFVFGGKWFDIGDYKFYNQAKTKFGK